MAPVKQNYQRLMDEELTRIGDARPSLLLHSCCGPCSSYVMEYLTKHFDVTLFYLNPNIWPEAEYIRRRDEQRRLLTEMQLASAVKFIEGEYRPEDYYAAVRGLEAEPEGGARCAKCFELRLGLTAKLAAERGFDYFTTTLTVSPHKNSQVINAIGQAAAQRHGARWLPSDFKKRDGYRRSLELSAEYGLYRQNYCGCEFSVRERDI